MIKLKDILIRGIEVALIGGALVFFMKDKEEDGLKYNSLEEIYSRYDSSSESAMIQFRRLRRIDDNHFLAEGFDEDYLYEFDERNARMYVERLVLKGVESPVSYSEVDKVVSVK